MRPRRFAVCWVMSLMLCTSLLPGLGAGPTTLLFEGEFYDTPYGSLLQEAYSMQFSIYNAPEGGTKLWPAGDWVETHPFVYVTRGRFTVALGSEGFPLTANVHTGGEVYVQVAVCLPAGYECGEHEPLPIRMPLQTSATMATPEKTSTPPMISTPLPSTTPPEAEVAESFMPAGIANDHMHWGETWKGAGVGLTLESNSAGTGTASIGLHGVSTFAGLSFGILGEITSSDPSSAGVKGTATRGIGVIGLGDPVYDTSAGGYFAGWAGVYGEASGAHMPGVRGVSKVSSGIGVWGESFGGNGYGGYFAASHGTGVYIGNAGSDGLSILQARDDGIEIHDAGFAIKHIYPSDLELGNCHNGISVGGVSDFGLWLGYAGGAGIGIGETEGNGLWVLDAGGHGVRVGSADECGLSIARTEEAGVHVAEAGTSGLVVDYASLFGVHVTSEIAAGVHAKSTRGPGGEFVSEESHSIVADGPALIGGRTPEQIGMLKWYEASSTPDPIEVNSGPSGLAFDGQYIWVCHPDDRAILQLHASDGRQEESFGQWAHIGPIADGTRLWLVHRAYRAVELCGYRTRDWKEEGIDALIHAKIDSIASPTALCYDGQSIWVGCDDGVYRLTVTGEAWEALPRVEEGALTRRTPWGGLSGAMFEFQSYPISNGCSALAFDGTYLWIAVPGTNRVLKLHARNMTAEGLFDVGRGPAALAFDGANMWVANYGDGTVTKLRASDGHILGIYAVGTNPRALVFDGFHIWVANEGDDSLTKLRAADGAVVGTYKTGRSPRALVFDGTHVWVANYDDDTLMKF